MDNKTAGIIFIVLAILIGIIIFLFNNALNTIVSETCTHGDTCPMYNTIEFNTYLSIAIIIVILLAGIAFILFFKDIPKQKKINSSDYKDLKKELKEEEKLVLDILIDANGHIFQSELVEKTKFLKAKVTRILDRLEAKEIIERKRRGMTNFIVLKK